MRDTRRPASSNPAAYAILFAAGLVALLLSVEAQVAFWRGGELSPRIGMFLMTFSACLFWATFFQPDHRLVRVARWALVTGFASGAVSTAVAVTLQYTGGAR